MATVKSGAKHTTYKKLEDIFIEEEKKEKQGPFST